VGNFTYVYMPIPVENATYTGVMFLGYPVGYQAMQYAITPGPICDLTVTFATNATAALWLPVPSWVPSNAVRNHARPDLRLNSHVRNKRHSRTVAARDNKPNID